MEYRHLGASGFKVPVLSFGTGTFGGKGALFSTWGTTDAVEARRLVDICLDSGVTMFDSADVYSGGVSESILGEAIRGRRDRVLISTKATFRSGEGPNDIGSSRFHLINAVDAALERLGTDYIDLFQLHGFDAFTPIEETLSTLDDLVRRYANSGLRHVLCTDIGRDGMLSGPNLLLYRHLRATAPWLALQASGGVRDVADVRAANVTGCAGVILGKALLDGRLELGEALAC